MSYENILVDVRGDGAVRTGLITLNRPKALNALNDGLMDELGAALKAFDADAGIGAIVITGSDKAFAAGADIEAMADWSFMDVYQSGFITRNWETIRQVRKPVIAAVAGYAMGGGCELAMACHMRVATTNSKFGQPEVNLGLIPGYGGTQRLVQLIGKGKGLELMMTAAMIDANEAKQLGLVNYVVVVDELLPKVKELLTTIMGKGPNAVGKVIGAVNAFYDSSVNGFDEEIKLFGECFGTEEMKEGVGAFLEKRKADFNR